MRVRYGKPIKVKSLVGNQTSFSFLGGTSAIDTTLGNQVYQYNWGLSGSSKFSISIVTGHKYLHVVKIKDTAGGASFYYKNTSGSSVPPYSVVAVLNSDNNVLGGTMVATSDYVCTYFTIQGTSSSGWNHEPEYYFILDLTDMFGSGKEPTREEFYNKYNKYFPLIATGEEITIDDKAGQVSLYSGLPSGYQRVEYIYQEKQYDAGTTNLAFIQSNLSFADLDAVEFDLAISAEGGLYNNIVLCAYNTSFYIIVDKTTHKANGFSSSTWSPNSTSLFNDELRHKVKVSGLVSSDTTKIRTAWDWSWWHKTKWYGLKLYKNNVIIQNLIPCYRKSDNVIGMYDLVGKQFYVNQGTGTFLKGNNVNNTISCKVAGGSSDIYYEYNQLVKNGNFIDSSDWSNTDGTTKAVSDNIMILTATSLGKYDFAIYQNIGNLKANDKYIVIFDAKTNSSSNKIINIYLTAGYVSQSERLLPNVWNSIGKIFSYDTDKTSVIAYFGKIGDSSGWANGDIIYFKNINIINLTTWFGVGKEPSTVEEFKEKFTKEYYGFCKTPIKLTRYQIEALPSYGYNQLLNNPTFVLSCTTSQVSGKWIGTVDFVANNKYLIKCYQDKTMTSNTRNTFLVYLNGSPTYENPAENYNLNSGNRGWIYTPSESGTGDIQLWVHTPSVAVNYSDFQVINLTDWYGAGNEPTTIEEFKVTFPNKYYPYSKKRLLNKYMINKLIN